MTVAQGGGSDSGRLVLVTSHHPQATPAGRRGPNSAQFTTLIPTVTVERTDLSRGFSASEWVGNAAMLARAARRGMRLRARLAGWRTRCARLEPGRLLVSGQQRGPVWE